MERREIREKKGIETKERVDTKLEWRLEKGE